MASRRALVVIDAQQEYFAPLGKVVLPGGAAAVNNVARALAWARGAGVPVAHIVHESRRPNPTTFAPGSPTLAIHPEATPAGAEPVMTKHPRTSRAGSGDRPSSASSSPGS